MKASKRASLEQAQCASCRRSVQHAERCPELVRTWRETWTGPDDARDSTFHCVICASSGGAFTVHEPTSLYGHLLDHRSGLIGIERGGAVESVEVDELALEALRSRIMRDHRFDVSCSTLADTFLQDHPNATNYDKSCLAQHIQDQVELWLEEEGFNS